MTSPRIPISWGELFDKITILEIKLKKLKAKAALANVDNEFKQLNKIYREQFEASVEASQLKGELKEINQRLWTIEDQIRDKEKNKVFDVQGVVRYLYWLGQPAKVSVDEVLNLKEMTAGKNLVAHEVIKKGEGA